jgi:cytochrome P450
MTTETQPASADVFIEFVGNPALRARPYEFYSRLRGAAPIHEVMPGIWLVPSYRAVADIFRDPRFSSDERNSRLFNPSSQYQDSDFGRVAQHMLLFHDEPDHKRLRDLVQKAFTRRVVEDLRGRIDGIVARLVESLIESERGDLISEFAYPLPVIVICELLGVPIEDQPIFGDWAKHLATRLEIQPLRTPESEAAGEAAANELIRYFEGLIERKRAHPEADLLTNLVAVEDAGDKLTHDELLATCLLLLIAGHETTANVIGNGVLALMENRDQWDRLVAEPTLARSAVEEVLRYDTPVQFLQRIPIEDVEVEGVRVDSGSLVGLLPGAANRDPAAFPQPDRLDITRSGEPLVAFGGGIHFCLGAPLARLEVQSALRTLAERVPGLQLDGEVRWRDSFVIHGLHELPVSTS